jgi:hypothetical protein
MLEASPTADGSRAVVAASQDERPACAAGRTARGLPSSHGRSPSSLRLTLCESLVAPAPIRIETRQNSETGGESEYAPIQIEIDE